MRLSGEKQPTVNSAYNATCFTVANVIMASLL
jgi:hypothetical protein